MNTNYLNLANRMVWSIVSKALDRSRNMLIGTSFLSMSVMISICKL